MDFMYVVRFIHGFPFFAWLCIMLSLTLGRTGDWEGGGGGMLPLPFEVFFLLFPGRCLFVPLVMVSQNGYEI